MSAPRNVAAHRLLKNAKWLDGFANVFGAVVDAFYKLPGTGGIKNVLHGTWPLGHPLHPAITDITIGAYTAAVALDVLFLFNSQAFVNARVGNEAGPCRGLCTHRRLRQLSDRDRLGAYRLEGHVQ